MARLGRILAGLTIAWALAAPAPALAQASESAVKAAFLPKFARYVTWPASARPSGSEPLVLCVIGNDPFGRMLDQASSGQVVDGRRIALRRLSSAAGAGGCHVAFVQGSRTEQEGQILAAIGQRPILTVTDARNGSQRGIIHFTVVGGRVRFFIDEGRASRHGLAVSSRLLALAVGVRQR